MSYFYTFLLLHKKNRLILDYVKSGDFYEKFYQTYSAICTWL